MNRPDHCGLSEFVCLFRMAEIVTDPHRDRSLSELQAILQSCDYTMQRIWLSAGSLLLGRSYP